MDEDFPLDHSTRVIIFPCYTVRRDDGKGPVTNPLGEGRHAVVILTDEDALNRYRGDLGVPEYGAVKYDTPSRLLADLRALPPQVENVCFDLLRRDRTQAVQVINRFYKVADVCRQLAAQVAPG